MKEKVLEKKNKDDDFCLTKKQLNNKIKSNKLILSHEIDVILCIKNCVNL